MSEYRWAVEEADTGLPVASGSATTEAAANTEMWRYVIQYAQDGSVRFWIRHKRKTVCSGNMAGLSIKASLRGSAERGMAFVAVVEYQPGDRGRTVRMTQHAGLQMQMVNLCAATVPNVDCYVMNVLKFCKQRGIDTSGSIVLKQFWA